VGKERGLKSQLSLCLYIARRERKKGKKDPVLPPEVKEKKEEDTG